MQFHPLKVIDIRKETADTVSVAFEVPENLEVDYVFLAGQYVTLRTTIDGEDVRRAYSICSAPHEKELRVAIKQVENGVFSTYANNTLQVGDVIDVMTPTGQFYTDYHGGNQKRYVLFAAGSGITPVMSILKHVLQTEKGSTVTMVYGNKDVDSIIFGKELDAIKNEYPSRFNFQLVFSRENRGNDLFYGRIDADKLAVWGKTMFDVHAADEFFMCGPEGMTNDIRNYLKENHVVDSKVHFELFTTSGAAKKSTTEQAGVSESKGVAAKVKLIIDDEHYDFELTKGTDILQAGVEAGVDLPYSCKGGVCCTCKAKLIEGEATMEMNYALLDEEVKDGYILTCQAHPTTDSVVVSFDD